MTIHQRQTYKRLAKQLVRQIDRTGPVTGFVMNIYGGPVV